MPSKRQSFITKHGKICIAKVFVNQSLKTNNENKLSQKPVLEKVKEIFEISK